MHLHTETLEKYNYWNLILAVSISHNPTQSPTINTGIAALLKESQNNTPAPAEATSIFGEDGFTFGDIIDIINPLQHIPIVSSLYRDITGDTIAPAMKIAGGALFGGPIGAVTSMITVAFQSQNEKESVDPDSPYIEKEPNAINSAAIADNTLTDNIKTNRTNAWVLSSENISHTGNVQANINTLQNRQVYQPGDGITNIAYNAVESYTDVVTSNKTPASNIDITIGSSTNPG